MATIYFETVQVATTMVHIYTYTYKDDYVHGYHPKCSVVPLEIPMGLEGCGLGFLEPLPLEPQGKPFSKGREWP